MDAVEKFEVGNLTVEIHQDTDRGDTSRDWDNLGTMVCFHRNYTLGDKHNFKTPDDFLMALAGERFDNLEDYLDNKLYRKMVTADTSDFAAYDAQSKVFNQKRREVIWDTIEKYNVILPVALLDHSGITMYVGSGAHSCDPGGWDSGQVGWIYASREKILENWSAKKFTKKLRAKAEEVLRGEVKTYDQDLTGDVYGYVIEDEDGNHVDSVWGFYGIEEARTEGRSAAESAIKTEAEEVEKISRCMAL